MKYIIYGAIFVIVIYILKSILNRPSKLKQEHDARMKNIKAKYSGKYDEVRPLPKDRKKYH